MRRIFKRLTIFFNFISRAYKLSEKMYFEITRKQIKNTGR